MNLQLVLFDFEQNSDETWANIYHDAKCIKILNLIINAEENKISWDFMKWP